MKTILVLTGAFIVLANYTIVSAQAPPPGAGDKSLEDRNIKNRSNDLERIKRDASKPSSKNQPQAEVMPAAKFKEIKEDFEQIQMSQSNIVDAYMKGKEIDFVKIGANAEQINKRGIRLKGNLFPIVGDQENDKKNRADKKKVEPLAVPQDLKTLIVDIDNALAAFTSNPIFTNPQIVNADHNAKAQSDLDKLIGLSAALMQEAAKHTK